jgi:hypothetical protein
LTCPYSSNASSKKAEWYSLPAQPVEHILSEHIKSVPGIFRIDADEKQIADLFSDNYAFTIPANQRPFAWAVQHVARLLDATANNRTEED